MKSLLKHFITLAVASLGLFFGFAQTAPAQVSHCTDGGCSDFEIDCRNTGGDVVCYNARSTISADSVDEHLCSVSLAIMDKNCTTKENPQPCIVAENRVIDRCFYLPTTQCVQDPDLVSDLLLTHPDVCLGTCDDVLDQLNNPNGPQALCNTDFQP